ncbi:protein artemis-like [Ostrinia furnacalis]|uniref:protein artemis-like n=1 Tax=Ostrinia furnacalis TaxID=93504 RepID=UPI00103946A6|nr:protein artemis-like [Ostrinia furnacalis]
MSCSMSSFNGIIAEIPGIAVDNFERCDRTAYFLSHCHTDHTQGLSSPQLIKHLEENEVKIYMSDVTAGIIGAIPCYDGVKKFIKTLKLGSKTHVKLPSQYEDYYLCEVTLIPAGHCFGSVMFLFQTPFTTVLFTGDFRTNSNDVSKLGQLHKDGEPIKIDKMYVDTTFMDKMYENFPKRSETVENAVAEIKAWLDGDEENAVALHPSARFGYEYLFNEIYSRLGVKVYVAERDWAIYSDFPEAIPSVTNKYDTRIHKCSNRSEKYPHRNCVHDIITTKYLFVHLSAMKWDNINIEQRSNSRLSDKRLDVCFSTHCSRSEIINFVTYFSPSSVVGFPNKYEVDKIEDNNVRVVFKASKRKISCMGGRRDERRRL